MTTTFFVIILDVNECLTDNGGCTHQCNNTIGSYNCSCWNGYELSSDNHNCIGKTVKSNIANACSWLISCKPEIFKYE